MSAKEQEQRNREEFRHEERIVHGWSPKASMWDSVNQEGNTINLKTEVKLWVFFAKGDDVRKVKQIMEKQEVEPKLSSTFYIWKRKNVHGPPHVPSPNTMMLVLPGQRDMKCTSE